MNLDGRRSSVKGGGWWQAGALSAEFGRVAARIQGARKETTTLRRAATAAPLSRLDDTSLRRPPPPLPVRGNSHGQRRSGRAGGRVAGEHRSW